MIRKTLVAAVIVICVFFLLPSTAPAIGGMGIGIRAGLVASYDHPVLEDDGIEPDDLTMFGGHVTVFSIYKISVEASGEYASRDYDRFFEAPGNGTPFSSGDVNLTVKDYAGYLTGRLKLISGIWGAHLGAGLNVHRLVYKMDVPDDLNWVNNEVLLPEDDWHTGFHVLVGASFGPPMTPIRIFGEARVAKVDVGDNSVSLTTVLAGVTLGLF